MQETSSKKSENIRPDLTPISNKIPSGFKHILDINRETFGFQRIKREDAYILQAGKIFTNFLPPKENSYLDLRNDDLRMLRKILGPLKKVHKLNVDCSKSSSNLNQPFFITDVGLGHLGKTLKGLTSLKALSLSFHNCEKITDKGLKNLSRYLKRLYSLETLSLRFSL